jgi:predicted acyl esterase
VGPDGAAAVDVRDALGDDATGTDGADALPGDVPTDGAGPLDGIGADADLASPGDAEDDVPVGPPPHQSGAFAVRPSVLQVMAFDAAPGLALELVDADGAVVASGQADEWGALLFRNVAPGKGYSVRPADAPDDYTGPLTVTSIEGSLPDASFYAAQTLTVGYGYLKVRDGTLLSYFLTLPGPVDQGPYPTVVNYSGYSPSRPGHSLGDQVTPFCGDFPVLCDAPDDPSNLVAALNGFATVGVNMRGTGCSGGAYDYFEPLQSLDGYDVIEIVAAQPWVQSHRVGMVGLSFPGISQLFVGAARPPSLAAIAPQSVIADSATSCLMPGGIYNDGFAFSWHQMVLDAALPYAHGWVKDVVAAGDAVCDQHQRQHGQQRDAITEALDAPWYTDEVAKPVDPTAWVDRVQVPVFLTGQWQDEQTGPHFAALLDKFTGAPVTHFVVTNGVHPDGFAPQALIEWLDFLNLYVADRVPGMSSKVKALGTVFMSQVFGAPLPFPASAYQGYPDAAAARAAYEAQPPVRVIFESGADPAAPGNAPKGTFEQRFTAWPIPGTVADRWYLQPDGGLAPGEPPADGGTDAFEHDPEAGERVVGMTGGINSVSPGWQWTPLVDGKAVAYVTEPLADDRALIGHGSVDLWVRVDADDADLEVNLSEVRPDGSETYVQSGWLRASHRALRGDATELRPIHSHRHEDIQPLTPGEWTYVRIEIMPFVHLFRAGSRVRVSIDTPGDSRASWRFRLLPFDTPPVIEIGHDAAHASSVALPLVPGVLIPTALPACDVLRGQMCRTYVPAANGG